MEICPVVYLFSENGGNAGFSQDMLNGNCAVSNPFLSCIFTILDVAIAFGGHIVTPLDTRVVVIVQDRGMGGIGDRTTQ
jgi:hypothetical protein